MVAGLVLIIIIILTPPHLSWQYKVKVMKQGTISDLKVEVQNVTKINQCMVRVWSAEGGV